MMPPIPTIAYAGGGGRQIPTESLSGGDAPPPLSSNPNKFCNLKFLNSPPERSSYLYLKNFIIFPQGKGGKQV